MSDKETIIAPLVSLLASIDAETSPTTEREILSRIAVLRENPEICHTLEWRAEVMAFSFAENYTWKNHPNGWGTYFGPSMGGTDSDGNYVNDPSLENVTEEVIDYWQVRSAAVSHPLLKARYAGLVWDLSWKACGKRADISLVRMRIEACIEVAEKGMHEYERDAIELLEHAVSLACSINDAELIEKSRRSLLDYDKKLPEDCSCGYGFSLEFLHKNTKAAMTDDERNDICQCLEERLSYLISPEHPDMFAAESVGKRLAVAYRSLGDTDSMERVLRSVGSVFEHMAGQADAMLAKGWLEMLASLYREFGLHDDAANVADKALRFGPEAVKSLGCISTEHSVTKEEMDGVIDSILADTLKESIRNIVRYFLPRRDVAEAELARLAESYPIMSDMPMQQIDSEGRNVASIGFGEQEGRLLAHLSQWHIQFGSFYLRPVMEALIDRFSPNAADITSLLDPSAVLTSRNQKIVSSGIAAYLGGDSIACIHILIPQIEAVIRELAFGGALIPVTKPNRVGGDDFIALNGLLRNEKMIHFLGDDVVLYLRVLLSDARGRNLRNRVCHGLFKDDDFSMVNADWILHAVLLLGLISKIRSPSAEKQDIET